MDAYLVHTHSNGELDITFSLHSAENFALLKECNGYDDDGVAEPLTINGKQEYFGCVIKLLAFVKAHDINIVDETSLWSDG